MKIQYMSDLHLEFEDNVNYFKDNPVKHVSDVLILAGDIVCDSEEEKAFDFYNDIRKKFKLIISVSGNHEFYNGNISSSIPNYKKKLSENHFKLNNEVLVYENTRFIVSTLWSKIDANNYDEIHRRLNDYHYIKKEGNLSLEPKDTNLYFDQSKAFLEKELKKFFLGKTIVVTHHVPSIDCVNPKWKDSNVLSAFVTDMNDLIKEHKIDAWVFGHQHEPSFIDEIHGTKMFCNPLGYSKEPNFKLFKNDTFFEI